MRDLRPAARDLAASTPNLERTFKVLNQFANMASFNPRGREGPDVAGREEGYLFWLAWLVHQSPNLFSTADAHGPLRSLVSGSCQTIRSIVEQTPELEFQLDLTPLDGPERVRQLT